MRASRLLVRAALMAPSALDYSDPRAVARAFSASGCGCSPRAQGLGQKLDDLTTIRGADNYRQAARRLKTTAAQIDPLAKDDPAWRALKVEIDDVAAEYEGASNIPFVGPGLNDTAWHQIEELQRQIYEWAERLRKKGQDVPVIAPPPEKTVSENLSDAAKAASGFLGGKPDQSLGDRFLPSLSTGTKVFLGLGAAALLLSQAKPVLERFAARSPREPERRSP